MPKVSFPTDFLWGAATSSYQIEGAWNSGGKGRSIWDTFSHTPGKISDGTTGDMACDHYHQWRGDIELMKALGLQAYRFSIAWPRILPNGRGSVNQEGLDFYSQLVDGLLEAGIQPNATLYHWDLPQTLQDAGGWPARDIVDAFTEYTDVVTRHLGDRVRMWGTFNEPYVSAHVGYVEGRHAPGEVKNYAGMMQTAHHLLLSHGRAVPIIRQNVADANVGIVVNTYPVHAASQNEADQYAAQIRDGILNRWYLDPLSGRGYPEDVIDYYKVAQDHVQAGDLKEIAAEIDWLGVNYYTREVVGANSQEGSMRANDSDEQTEMGWEVYPPGLLETLKRLVEAYRFSADLYVTENGAAYADEVSADGRVHDQDRVSYYQRHLAQAAEAIEQGIPLKGYFAWSLLDNFEWAHGYSKRFGIIYVNFETQQRILKDSALWLKNVIAQNGFEL